MTLVGVILALTLRLWEARLDVPFLYGGDANAHAALPKMIDDHGWYEHNPSLNAPFGQEYHDLPLADDLQLLAMKGIAAFTDSYGVIVNSYYLLTYFLVALVALWAFRRLGLPPAASGVLALLYTFQPYHYLRGELHLFLSGYYVVPIAAVWAVDILRGTPLFTRRGGEQPLRWASPGLLAVLLGGVAIGTTSSYYTAFTLLLVGAALAIRLVRGASGAVVGSALVALLAVVLAQFAVLAPDVRSDKVHGPNEGLVERERVDSENFSFKLAQLVLPVSDHRIGSFADLREDYTDDFPIPSEGGFMALGAVASTGFLWMLARSLALPIRRRNGRPSKEAPDEDRLGALATMSLFSFLLGTMGGISTLVALFVWSQVRAWNRLSIYVAFFALAAVGFLLERARRALRGRRGAPLLIGLTWVVVLVVGVLDQTTESFVPRYDRVAREFRSDQELVRRIEATMPSGALVFQLPVHPFPETPDRHRMRDYDHLKGYLHSRSLRWSHGGMKGRPSADWQLRLDGQPVREAVRSVVASGFHGIWVDRFAYEDGGTAVEGELRGLLGSAPMVSRDRRFAFFDARDYGERLAITLPPADLGRLRDLTLYPAELYGGISPAGLWLPEVPG